MAAQAVYPNINPFSETLGQCLRYRDDQGPKGIELKFQKELRASEMGLKDR